MVALRLSLNMMVSIQMWSLLTLCTSLLALVTGQSQGSLDYRIVEELPPSSFIGNVLYDSKLDEKYESSTLQTLQFRFLTQPKLDRNYFSIEENTGVLRTTNRVDRDHICPQKQTCTVQLDIAVQPMQYFQIIKVTVEIVDINDNTPRFPDDQMVYEILESASPGNSFVIPSAVDPDSDNFSIQRYQLVTLSRTRKFKLKVTNKIDGSTDVRLILTSKLDREQRDFYQVKVLAVDGGAPALTGQVLVNITVLDANDNSPKFNVSTYEVTINENAAKYTTIAHLRAYDPDAHHNGEIEYSFSSQTHSSYGKLFGINNVTGDIFVKGIIDYEAGSIYHLSVLARDKGPDSLPAQATVIVRVRDVNDHTPQITVNTLTGTTDAKVEETQKIGVFVAHISVVDRDLGSNAAFNCSLNSGSFTLQQTYSTEYQIVTATKLDRERRSSYHLTLRCRDWGKPPKSSSRDILVTVLDKNDHAPRFVKPYYYGKITENNFEGAYILQVNATDGDFGPNADIRYKLHKDAGALFRVEPQSGMILANVKLDREQVDRVRFHVIAMDRGKPPQSATAIVSVTINDQNDSPPKFSQSSYSFGVYENQPKNTEVGKVFAVDADAPPFDKISFEMIPSQNALNTFKIDPISGIITTLKQLDRERQTVYYMVVVASNRGFQGMTSSVSVSIYVADKNDNPPVFEFPSQHNNTVYVSNMAPIGYVIAKLQASDLDIGSNSRLSFGLRHGHSDVFNVDQATGAVTVETNLKDIEYELFELTVEVKDFGTPQKEALQSLNVVVNKSIIFTHYDAHILAGHNFTIVVSLACVSGFITVILVIAIVIIRRQDRHAKDHKYNCRTEALKMLSSRGSKDSNSETEMGKALSNGECLSSEGPDRPKKEVSFSLDPEAGVDDSVPDKMHQSWPSTIDHRTMEPPQACSSMLTSGATSPPDNGRLTPLEESRLSSIQEVPQLYGQHDNYGRLNAHGRPWTLTQKELEVHQLLQMLKQDQDAESACSGEASTTDSGRGASEEGDHGHGKGHPEAPLQHAGIHPQTNGYSSHHHHHQPQQVPYPTGHHPMQYPTLAKDQVVPEEQSFSSNHSYSSHQPQRLHTFTPTNSLQRNHQPPRQPKAGDNTSDLRKPQQGQRGQGIPPRPLKIIPTSAVRGQYMPFRNHHESGVTEDSDNSDNEGIKYSCADMTNNTPTACRLDSADFPDDTTTTSGSYVVDPQELCNEIDELFFKDMVV